jgi:hypothetical protein
VAAVSGMYVTDLVMIGTTIFAGTGSGVYRLNNTGVWTAVNSGLSDTYLNTLAVSGSYLYAGTNGGVSLSTDNGDNWSTVNGGLPGGGVYAADLAVNSTYIYMVSGFSVYRSPLP